MITYAALKALKLTPEDLKKRFGEDKVRTEKEEKLWKRWQARAQAGYSFNLAHYRLYLALDRAWNVPFYQTTQTLLGFLKDLIESKNQAAAMQAVKSWKMTHLLVDDVDPKTGQPTGKSHLSVPVLSEICLSIARSATLMRTSRLANERRQSPLYKYEPAHQTEVNRLKGELMTQRVDQMAREFSYAAVQDQAIQCAAMYGQQLQFPLEEWYKEMDQISGTEQKVGKEGIRLDLPHPTRVYFDLAFPLRTLNDGTGCSYAGTWKVSTIGAMRGTPSWWNMDKIKATGRIGQADWGVFFQTTGQCRMSPGASTQFSEVDRQRIIENAFYATATDDQPIWITEHYEVINLKYELDESLPDVNVWFRVTLAGDDTPVYVAALPARPVTAWLWESMDSLAIQTSMLLALLPYQDHSTNILTQAIIGSKQRFTSVNLFDTDVLDPATVRLKVENPNETQYRGLTMIPFSGKKLAKSQGNLDQIFKTFRFPIEGIDSHISILAQLIALMERDQGFSAQETGGYASHEQSAEEMNFIRTSTGHRADFIGASLDRAVEATKSMLYSYLTTYGTLDAYGHISKEYSKEAVKKAGFTIDDEGKDGVLVHAPVANLHVENWASHRDGPNRVPWTSIGREMAQLAGNFAQSVPPEQVVPLVNMALEAMQLPQEFRLKPMPPQEGGEGAENGPEAIQKWVMKQFEDFATNVKAYVNKTMTEAVGQMQPPQPSQPPPPMSSQLPVVLPQPQPQPVVPMPPPGQQEIPPELAAQMLASSAGY